MGDDVIGLRAYQEDRHARQIFGLGHTSIGHTCVNFGPAFDVQRSNRGVFLIDPVRLLNFRIGFLPGSGVRSLTVTTPDLPGIEGLPFFAQGWFFGADGLTHSSANATVLLDPSY